MSSTLATPLAVAFAVVSWLMPDAGLCFAQQPLGFNNVVVFQSGDGSSSLSTPTNKALLKEFSPGGTLLQTFEMPSTGTGTKLVTVGNSTSEGTLAISPDGKWITYGGYDSGTGVAGITSNTTVPRVAGILNTTTGTYSLTPMGSALSGVAIRGVATNDGNNLWSIGASTGLQYGTVAGGTGSFGRIGDPALSGNYNAIGVYSGTGTDLYASSSNNGSPTVGVFGPGALPTGTATTFTAAPNVPNSAAGQLRAGFVYLDVNPSIPGLDTLYVANAINSSDGILKYALDVTGTWVARGSILSSGLTLRGLSGFVSGTNVRLFTTTTGTLFTYWDADAGSSSLSGAASTLLTQIATAPAGTAFRGVVVVPEPGAIAMCVAGAGALVANAVVRRRRHGKFSRQRPRGSECDAATF